MTAVDAVIHPGDTCCRCDEEAERLVDGEPRCVEHVHPTFDEILERAAERPAAPAPDGRKRPARDVLVELVEREYTIGRTEDERTYLVPHEGSNVALFSGPAKADMARRYRVQHGTTIGRSPLDEAWTTVVGMAGDVAKAPLPLRVAAWDGAIVIDVGDVSGRAIIVERGGWEMVERSPVTFRRSKATLPLPDPVAGGSVDELFEILPFAPESRDLVAAWLTSTLFAEIPHPAPVLRGEQGAAKSTTARAITRLLDPCMAATQKPPKTDDDWSHACSARWIVAVDNVSTVPEWWSDALCRTVTGDGWLRRELYTDDDVIVTAWRRCVILNGISLGAGLRPDLAERLMFLELARPGEYLTEAEVDARLDAIRPRVLGAILDRAVVTLKALEHVEPVRDLRMADFAHLLAAHDHATGAKALAAYRREVGEAFDEALAGDTVATAVVTFMSLRGDTAWEGTASELLAALDLHRPTNESEFWPKTAHHLSQVMARSAPALRRIGIEWRKPTATGRQGQRVARLDRSSGADAADAPAPADALGPADADSLLVVSGRKEGESEGIAGEHNKGEISVREPNPRPRCVVCGGDAIDEAGRCRAANCESF